MEKRNDWIAALINRPEYTMVDLYANDIKPDNTGLQDRDYYKNVPQVINKFKDESGHFDEKKYNEFYDSALRMYNAYSDGDFINKMIDNIERSPYDWTKINNPNVQDVSAVISIDKDPYRHSKGLKNLYDVGDPQFSLKEVAEANFVRDENGNTLNWTPNDKGGLIKGLFRPTLVMSQYEQDTIEYDDKGNKIVHKAGDYKFDENGNPYTELLGNRESYGKQVLNYSDTFTVEGTKLNKWDPFDSDGIEKSIGGTIAKTTLKLAPFLFGPTVSAIAGTAYAMFGLASALPVFGKMINGIVSNNDTEFGKSLTKWESYMERFAPAKSESAQNSFWNFENIADIIASSASQLYSQRQIANIPKWLSKGKETIANAKMGQVIATGYMAMTSAQDSYSSFIEAGANETTAGLASLATMAGFYTLMSQDYWKKHVFGGTWLDENSTMYRSTMKEWIKEQSSKLASTDASKNPAKWYNKFQTKVVDFLKNNKTLNKVKPKVDGAKTSDAKPKFSLLSSSSDYLRSGINEGFEETIEELSTDFVKGITLGLEALGVDVTKGDKKLDYGFSSQDFLSRYTTTFLGGALGGVVFEGLNKKDALLGPKVVSLLDKDVKERLVWLELNGYHDQMVNMVEKEFKKGNLGNKNLSSKRIDENDKNSPFKPGTESDNQNLLMKNVLIQALNEIRYNIDNFSGLLKQSDLYKAAYEETEKRAKDNNLTLEEYVEKEKVNPFVNTLLALGAGDEVMDDYIDVTKRIIDINAKIKKAEDEELSRTIDSDSDKRASNKYIQNLIKERDQLVKTAENIKTGKNLDSYLERVFFAVSPELINFYINPKFGNEEKSETSYIHTNVKAYTKWKYNLLYDSLPKHITDQLDKEFEEFKDSKERVKKIRLAQRIHSTASKNLKAQLEELNSDLHGYKTNPYFSSSTYGEYASISKEILSKNIEEKQKELQKFELENEDFQTNPEWTSLNMQLKVDKLRLDQMDLLLRNSWLSRMKIKRQSESTSNTLDDVESLTIDLQERDTGVPLVDNERLALISLVKDYYNNLIDNKIINASEDPLKDALTVALSGIANDFDARSYPSSFFDKYFEDPSLLTEEQSRKIFDEIYNKDQDTGYNDYDDYIEENDTLFSNGFDLPHFLTKLNDLSEEKQSEFFGNQVPLITEFSFASKRDDTRLFALENALNELVTTLQNNTFKFTEKYDAIKANLLEKGIDEDVFKEKVIEHIFKGNKELFKELTEVINLRNESKVSKAYNLIKNVELVINGKNSALWDVLEREERALYSKKSLQEYTTDPFSKSTLEYGLQVVNLLLPQVAAAANGGFNSQLNVEKQKLNKELLPIIDVDAAKIIYSDLEHIASKLRFLLDLANRNKDSQWREQQDSAIHMNPMYISRLLTFSPTINASVPDLDLEKIWNEVSEDVDLENVSEENYPNFDKAVINFENKVYEIVNSTPENKKLFKKALIDIFGANSSLSMVTSEYSKFAEDISDWNILGRLMEIGFTNNKEFLGFYKAAILQQQTDKDYVPFPGQEAVVKQMYSHFENMDDYNEVLNGIAKKFLERSNSDFLNNRTVLENAIFIDGNSAVGKSTAISYTFQKILKLKYGNDVEFRGVAKCKERFENLKINLGLSQNETKELDDLINELWKAGNLDVNNPDFFPKLTIGTTTQHPLKLRRSFNLNKDKFFGSKNSKKVLVFDEATFATEYQLQILKQWAKENNIFLVLLGNRKQNASVVSVNMYDKDGKLATVEKDGKKVQVKSLIHSGIDDTLVFSTPILKASLRNQNAGKNQNKNAVETAFTLLSNQLDEDPDQTFADLKYDPKDHPIELLSYQDEINGEQKYYGEHIVSDDSILEKLIELKDKHNRSVIIVTDNPSNYEAYISQGIKVFTPASVQGEEADYVFLDHDFISSNTFDKKDNAYLFFRDFYTMITRSKQATFIKIDDPNKSFLNTWNINSNNTNIAGSEILSVAGNKDVLDKFKSWRLELLKDIPDVGTTNSTSEETATTNESTESENSSDESSNESSEERIRNGDLFHDPSKDLPDDQEERETSTNDLINSWKESVERGEIRDDNAKDYKKRRELKDNNIQAVDVSDFIEEVNKPNGKYHRFKKMIWKDEDIDDKNYQSLLSYLSLGFTRALHQAAQENVTLVPFSGDYLKKYVQFKNDYNKLNVLINAILNTISNSDNEFIIQSLDNGRTSTVFIPLIIDGKFEILPIFQLDGNINGYISIKNLISLFKDSEKNSVKSIAISSFGQVFKPLTQVAKNKAFVLDDAYVFVPSYEDHCDVNNENFRRRNSGTSNQMLLDIPVAIDNSSDIAKARFSTKEEGGVITSYVNTDSARLIRSNLRAENFDLVWKLINAWYVVQRGIKGNPVISNSDAQNLIRNVYGDAIDGLDLLQTVDQNKVIENAASNNAKRKTSIRVLNTHSLHRFTSVWLKWLNDKMSENNAYSISLWKNLLNVYGNNVLSEQMSSGYRYQTALFFGVKNNNDYDNFVFRAKSISPNPENKPEYEITLGDDPSVVLSSFTLDKSLTDYSPVELLELIQSKLSEFSGIPDKNDSDNEIIKSRIAEFIRINPENISDLLDDETLIFGTYTRGAKNVNGINTTFNPDEASIHTYFSPFETSLVDLFLGEETRVDQDLSEALSDFEKYVQESNTFKYGIFLNMSKFEMLSKSSVNDNKDWRVTKSTNNDKFVTDIVEVIPPLYVLDGHIDGLINRKPEKSEFEILTDRINGIDNSKLISSEEIGLDNNVIFNTGTGRFSYLDNETKIELTYLGVNKKDGKWNCFLTDKSATYVIELNDEQYEKIQNVLKDNNGFFIGWLKDTMENIQKLFYKDNRFFLIDDGFNNGKSEVYYFKENGHTKILDGNGIDLIENVDYNWILDLNTPDIQIKDETTFTKEGNNTFIFSNSIIISKNFIKMQQSDFDGNEQQYEVWKMEYLEENETKKVAFYDKDGNLITTLNRNINLISKLASNLKEVKDSIYYSRLKNLIPVEILDEIKPVENDLNKINDVLDKHKYEIGVKLIVDADGNIETDINKDIVVNFFANKLALKDEINSVYLLNKPDSSNSIVEIKVELKNGESKSYRFKIKENSTKHSEYYKNDYQSEEIFKEALVNDPIDDSVVDPLDDFSFQNEELTSIEDLRSALENVNNIDELSDLLDKTRIFDSLDVNGDTTISDAIKEYTKCLANQNSIESKIDVIYNDVRSQIKEGTEIWTVFDMFDDKIMELALSSNNNC